jgi:hypothetical protein
MYEHRDEELARALSELPVPPTSDDFFARLRAQIDRPRPVARRRLFATVALVGVALVVGGVAGAELAGPSRGATPPPVTSFQPALGWNTFETNVLADPTQPEVLSGQQTCRSSPSHGRRRSTPSRTSPRTGS